MIIEKDKYLNIWIVWKKEGSLLRDVFKSRLKRECKEYVKRHSK